MINFSEEGKMLKTLNEMFVNVLPSLPTNVENSIYYAKLKNLLHSEIITFTKEKFELKGDLTILRMNVGEQIDESFIREYMEDMKAKYNTVDNNIGIEYHIEQTRIDLSCIVFCIIKRDQVYCKKFVFRFRKAPTTGLMGVSNSGLIKEEQEKNSKFDELFSNLKKKSD